MCYDVRLQISSKKALLQFIPELRHWHKNYKAHSWAVDLNKGLDAKQCSTAAGIYAGMTGLII